MHRMKILNIYIPYDGSKATKYKQIGFRDWVDLYQLIQKKKGIIDGDYAEHYLKELLQVADLRFATPIQYDRAVKTLTQMPDKNIN